MEKIQTTCWWHTVRDRIPWSLNSQNSRLVAGVSSMTEYTLLGLCTNNVGFYNDGTTHICLVQYTRLLCSRVGSDYRRKITQEWHTVYEFGTQNVH